MYNDRFIEEISNDLNISNAITVLYDLLKDNEVNGHTKLSIIKDFDKVFSLNLIKEVEEDESLTEYILEMIAKRDIAKREKDFATADKIRNELLDQGIELMDTREGTKYKINK